ncbi:MAG: 2-C-methyl-D-erythritol 4-phosphate cytidylyltransferase [Egibacteraceae bacterium]
MSAWAILLTEIDDAGALAQWHAALRRSVDGVVVAGTRQRPNTRRGPNTSCPRVNAGAGADPLTCVLTALAVVPPTVERIVYLDEPSLGDLDLVAAMLPLLVDGHAAVVRVAAVTDALKRVEEETLIGGVERDGLYAPRPPHVLRRSALERLRPGVAADPAAALALSGHRLRLYFVATTPSAPAHRPERHLR